jgi:hypothetical protein
VRADTAERPPIPPVLHAKSQENRSTTIVRTAVATSESVSRMPILAKIAVSPANSAEPNAKSIHMGDRPPSFFKLVDD